MPDRFEEHDQCLPIDTPTQGVLRRQPPMAPHPTRKEAPVANDHCCGDETGRDSARCQRIGIDPRTHFPFELVDYRLERQV